MAFNDKDWRERIAELFKEYKEDLLPKLTEFRELVGDALNKINSKIPNGATLTHLEDGTDTEQRTYTPKDLSEFVDDNKPKADILSFSEHADEETTSKIPFTIEDGDLDGNSANNEYEVPVDGWYKADFVGYTEIVSGGSNDKQAIIRISIGSSNGSQKTVSRSNIGDGVYSLNLFSILTKLEQGDKVYIEVLNQLDSKVLVVGKMSVLKIK